MTPALGKNGNLADWNTSSLDILMAHIVERHHAYLRRELPLMERGIAQVVEIRNRADASTLAPLVRTFRYFSRELQLHLRKEEEVLFPLIRRMEAAFHAGARLPRLPFGPMSNPIGIMEEDHTAEQRQLEKMLALTGNHTAAADAGTAYRSLFERIQALEADMRIHVHLENEILFRRVNDMERAWW